MIKFVGLEIKYFFLFVIILTTFVSAKKIKQMCPDVSPMKDFDMNQFLGTWYVIQKTITGYRCIQHQITPLENEREYKISQVSPIDLLDKLLLKNEHTYAGFLVANAACPARMKVHYAFSIAEEAYIVVTTDYETYAAVVECTVAGRTATILSRTQSLSEFRLDEIRAKLEAFSIRINDLSTISHKDCPRDNIRGLNIQIDHDLLSPDKYQKESDAMWRNLNQTIQDALNNGVKFLNSLFKRKN